MELRLPTHITLTKTFKHATQNPPAKTASHSAPAATHTEPGAKTHTRKENSSLIDQNDGSPLNRSSGVPRRTKFPGIREKHERTPEKAKPRATTHNLASGKREAQSGNTPPGAKNTT